MEERIKELEQELAKSEASRQELKSNYELLKSKLLEKDREISSIKRGFTNYKKETKEIIKNQDETIRILTEKLEKKEGMENV